MLAPHVSGKVVQHLDVADVEEVQKCSLTVGRIGERSIPQLQEPFHRLRCILRLDCRPHILHRLHRRVMVEPPNP
ncbi:MAG: hypothetical protein NT167_00880, partial [Verrucomicrobia bacterium]|nr:hypothetical protein [Verrucomicrobiota bacterium]